MNFLSVPRINLQLLRGSVCSQVTVPAMLSQPLIEFCCYIWHSLAWFKQNVAMVSLRIPLFQNLKQVTNTWLLI